MPISTQVVQGTVAALMLTLAVACGGGGHARCDKLWTRIDTKEALGASQYGKAARDAFAEVCPKLSDAELACLEKVPDGEKPRHTANAMVDACPEAMKKVLIAYDKKLSRK